MRLSQHEVATVGTEGLVSDSINFGTSKLIYTLQVADRASVTASFNGEFITVSVPQAICSHWAATEQVGFDAEQLLEGGEKLYILVEKDFQCLKPRAGEDESDLFKNPQAEC